MLSIISLIFEVILHTLGNPLFYSDSVQTKILHPNLLLYSQTAQASIAQPIPEYKATQNAKMLEKRRRRVGDSPYIHCFWSQEKVSQFLPFCLERVNSKFFCYFLFYLWKQNGMHEALQFTKRKFPILSIKIANGAFWLFI